MKAGQKLTKNTVTFGFRGKSTSGIAGAEQGSLVGAYVDSRVEDTALTVLLAVFGAMLIVLTAMSVPSLTEMLLAVCVGLVCAAGSVWLQRRPAWRAELTEAGIICRDERSGATKLLGWEAYRCAYELRTSRGDGCLLLATGARTRRELLRACRRLAVTGQGSARRMAASAWQEARMRLRCLPPAACRRCR